MSGFYGYIPTCPCNYCKEEREREVADKAKAAEQVVEEPKVVPPTSRLLTAEMVLKGSPCYEYRTRFMQRYGAEGVMVTPELALSQKDEWDWEWAGTILLSRKAKAEFSRRGREADNAFDEAMQPYWGLSNTAIDEYYVERERLAMEAYGKGLSYHERLDYVNERASRTRLEMASAAQRAANSVAMRVRQEARIRAFAELFIADGPAYEEEHKDDAPFVSIWDENGEELDTYEEGYSNYSDYYEDDTDY